MNEKEHQDVSTKDEMIIKIVYKNKEIGYKMDTYGKR